LRRVFSEQFEMVEGKLQPIQRRPPRSVQNPHDPDAHYANKGKKQWVGYKVHVVESVDPDEPAKRKGEPTEQFITEILTTEAALDEMAGLAEALKQEQQHHEIKPPAMYADGGYVTETTLGEAEQSGMELLGPTRPDPHKGPYNADAFEVDLDKRQAICPQGKISTQWSHIQDAYMGTEYYRIEWASQCDRCAVQKKCTRAKTDAESWWSGRATIWCRSDAKKCASRNTPNPCIREMALREPTASWGAACNVKRYLKLLAFQMKSTALSAS
jgi:hypothetical protein